MEVWSKEPSLESESNASVTTWERRLNGTCNVQALLQPAHVAAFLLDPLYGVATPQKTVTLSIVSSEREEMAQDLMGRVGGEINYMTLRGWDGNLADGARSHRTQFVFVGKSIYSCTQYSGSRRYIQLHAILWVSNVPRPVSCFVSTTAAK
jgi:hypothetical protein